MDVTGLKFQEKRKLAKEIGLNVPRGTKKEELDKILAEYDGPVPEKPVAQVVPNPEPEPETFEFPEIGGIHDYFVIKTAKPEMVKLIHGKYNQLKNIWSLARDFYMITEQDPKNAPLLPKEHPPELKDLYRCALKWYMQIALIPVTLTRTFGIGGRKLGPGRNIKITREINNEILHSASKKNTQNMKLITGKTKSNYLDHSMGIASEQH